MNFDVNSFFYEIPRLIIKVPYTLFLGIVAFVLAFFLGIIIMLLKQSRNKVINVFATIYVSYFRSTPYITQLFILYFGLPQIIPVLKSMTAQTALIVSIAMSSAAFISEILRGGLLAVDKGQIEAAYSIGMTKGEALKTIVFPQAIVVSLPALSNSFITMLKSTSMGFTIGVVELLAKAKMGSAVTYRYLESYVAVGLIYWVMIVLICQLQKKIENHFSRYMV